MAHARANGADLPPTYDDAVPPRLTRLEMIGFKSFASKTTFQFEKGITAVVGPNGSGKSNIADAVRWALGETSYSSLRSKKTEDVIFAGGNGKAPAGMAEVTLTFDNATGWLPIDFNEVTVTRRAFRSGETAYLINGRKVRLKDVHQLTAGLGQSYTVVGQGLVDSALSQRAEERRGLFEHAADLTGLRLKAVEAERNLAETENNSARLIDLLGEVEPRLRQLERAARQANEYRDVRDRLRFLQRNYFRSLLTELHARLERVEAAAEEGLSLASLAQTRHDELTARVALRRADRETLFNQLDTHRSGLAATNEQLRRIAHEREIAQERLTSFAKRQEDMAETQDTLETQLASVLEESTEIAERVQAAVAIASDAREQLRLAEDALASERRQRTDMERERSRLLALSAELERSLAEINRQRALTTQRFEIDDAERDRNELVIRERADRSQRLRADLIALDQAEAVSGFRLTSIDAGVIEHSTSLAAANAVVVTARDVLQSAERELADANARLREVRRIHESGAGLFAGVRTVTQAAKARELQGIRGTLAELITLPQKYDTALEVALGSHLQDIVVETWAQAENAIALLKRTNGGRATFQPIDTVRGRKPNVEAVRDLVELDGVHGVACDLIDVKPEIAGIVYALLGRSLIVTDLDVARACLPHMPSGWNAITLTGEIVRTSGSVTGGAAAKESGALARERDLRELPFEIEDLEKKAAAARDGLEQAQAAVRIVQDERQQLESERSAILATRREREVQRGRIANWLTEIEREEERSRTRATAMETDRAAAEQKLANLDESESELVRQRDSAFRALEALPQVGVEADTETPAEQAYREAQRIVAANDERLSGERRRESSLAAQRTTLEQERAIRAERGASVAGEITALTAQIARLDSELGTLTASETAARATIEPLEAEHTAIVAEIAEIEVELDSARADLIDAERSRGTAGMDAERVRGEVAALHQRIEDDLELEDPMALLDEEVESDDQEIPTDAEQEIHRLKERLRRVGYAGENAVEDYEQERERHAFLREQLADVEGAAAAIRTMLDELRQTMHDRFEETFQRVSTVFSQMFSTLFGGGTARLIMVVSEDGDKTGGIDIVAQPPGKRLQSLALLSGGERALTGVALLFAILKVNPTPFCLLDEVDAALDEANVVRFRDQLGHLAAETQAIIITHNRGTIEAANTLYGVSMKDDGTSTVLSLRLSDVVLAD